MLMRTDPFRELDRLTQQMLGTAAPVPIAPSVLQPRNGWLVSNSKTLVAVYAGAAGNDPSIGRVVTAPEVRGTGLGKTLMAEALRRVETLVPGQAVKIAAQRRLEQFYLGLGFKTVSAPYEEDGIIHVDMIR